MKASKLYEKYKACDGRITTDSRTIERGAIFFALRGENFDANRYVLSALEAGAAYAVADDPALRGVNKRIMVVDNVLQTLQDLAREHRRALGIPIFALTGSNGKTTTKEFTRAALSTKFDHVGCTMGNLNNHIGVPLTLLGFNKKTQIGIVEMGANHQDEIATLCRIAEPNVGLITNVGRAHLEGFGGEAGVRKGKGEMFDYLEATGGVAIYNADDPTLLSMVDDRLKLAAIPYSGKAGADVELSLFGAYNQLNATAALAVANYFDVDQSTAARAIAAYNPTNNRSQIIERTTHNNRLIADCYNANPSSMESAVNEFLASDSTTKVLILGAMRELGQYSDAEHRRLYDLAKQADVSYFIGEEFEGIVPAVAHFESADVLSEKLAQTPISNSTILLKGSRTNKLEMLIEKL